MARVDFTKDEIRAYINGRIAKQIKGVQEEIRKIAEEVSPIIASVVTSEPLEKAYALIKEHGDAFTEKYDWLTSYYGLVRLKERTQSYSSSLLVYTRTEIELLARRLISNFAEDSISIPIPAIRDWITEARVRVAPLRKRELELLTLQKELNHAINAARKGKDAYRDLVALGVDMRELESSSANLPAVQTLSVDVCLINGNCDEVKA